jgi:negative regulator of flagellin synthesis FlgM
VSSKIGGFSGSQTPSVGAGRSADVGVSQRPQGAASGGPPAASSGAGSGGSHDVQITDAARQLATLEQTLRDLPAVNQTRVAQITNSIEQGTYTVHPQQIADRLLQLEQALGQLRDQAEAGGGNPDTTDG